MKDKLIEIFKVKYNNKDYTSVDFIVEFGDNKSHGDLVMTASLVSIKGICDNQPMLLITDLGVEHCQRIDSLDEIEEAFELFMKKGNYTRVSKIFNDEPDIYDVLGYKQFGYIESNNDITSCNYHVVTCISVYTNGINYMINSCIAGQGHRRDYFENYKELKKYCAYHYKNGITDIKMTENCEELWKKFMEER